jgi:hypothetical protein
MVGLRKRKREIMLSALIPNLISNARGGLFDSM